ncbi:MAG TPA: hypothetical protein VHG28_12820 [Longimicrobiaceae bacterium]|nr:hypothetical protein [Longimicrobiaceae bacterium]
MDPAFQPRVVDGRLAFRDMGHFEGYLKQLGDAGTADLANAEGQLAGFQSLRAYLDPNEWTEESARTAREGEPSGNEATALEKDGVVRADFPVSDQLLSVLNHEGEVLIEQSAFKLTRDHVYQVAAHDVALLDQVPTLSSAPPATKDSLMTVRDVETTEIRDGAVSTQGGATAARMLGTCYVYAGSSYRMRGSTSITNLWFYAEARVTTEWQRKKSFLWWSWWANQWQSGTLRHEWWGNLYYGFWGSPLAGPVPVNGWQSGTGTDRISNNLLWMAGWGVRVAGTLNARHYVNNWAVNGSCNT